MREVYTNTQMNIKYEAINLSPTIINSNLQYYNMVDLKNYCIFVT